MILIIKKNFLNNIKLIFLTCLSIVIYWYFFDITQRIFPDMDQKISNLSRYKIWYTTYDLNTIFEEKKITGDLGYYILTFFLNSLKLKYEIFLFILFNLYLLLIIKSYYKITNLNNSLITNILLIILSIIWMNSLIGAATRQGCALMIIYYCFFLRSEREQFTNYLLFFLALTFHLSIIIFFPILFLKNFMKKNLIFLEIIFYLMLILYVTGLIEIITPNLINILTSIGIDLRSLNFQGHYTSGFSLFKLIAIVVPFVALKLSERSHIFSKKLYSDISIFYLPPAIIGITFSNMAYYDRILLYSWSITPIMCFVFVYSFINLVGREKI